MSDTKDTQKKKKPLPYYVEGCKLCEPGLKGKMCPSHHGRTTCESGSLASGGKRSHCTCDTCF